jgi:hypothetical protein
MKRMKTLTQAARGRKPQHRHNDDPRKAPLADDRIWLAAFFWKNDMPDGLGVRFLPDQFSPEELTGQFGEAECVNDFATPGVINLVCRAVAILG